MDKNIQLLQQIPSLKILKCHYIIIIIIIIFSKRFSWKKKNIYCLTFPAPSFIAPAHFNIFHSLQGDTCLQEFSSVCADDDVRLKNDKMI